MKKYIFTLFAAMLLIVQSCDYDSYPYYYTDEFHPNQQETFQLTGTVFDADSLWTLPSIQVLLIPSGVRDTFVTYTDTSGVFSFKYGQRYGKSAVLNFNDTTGVYESNDTLLWFSNRDYNSGIRKILVNL